MDRFEYVTSVISRLAQLPEHCRTYSAPRHSWSSEKDATFDIAPDLQARLFHDCADVMARTSLGRVNRTVLPAPGYQLLTVEMFQLPRLVAMLGSNDADITLRVPGGWEAQLGLDSPTGTPPILPNLFQDLRDPNWRAFISSGRSQWPPRYDGPLQRTCY